VAANNPSAAMTPAKSIRLKAEMVCRVLRRVVRYRGFMGSFLSGRNELKGQVLLLSVMQQGSARKN
jgi:acetolactate synthase regulatory subunit